MRKVWKKIGIAVMALLLLYFAFISWAFLALVVGVGFFRRSSDFGLAVVPWFSPVYLIWVAIVTVFSGYNVYKNIKAKKYDRALFWGVGYLVLPWILMAGSCVTLIVLGK